MTGTLTLLLILLLATNGAPIVAARIFRSRGALPVDLGGQLADGKPLFGSAKTWRGLFSALFTACILSLLFGFGAQFGLIFGALVMTGDLFSSFIKRRRGLAASDRSAGLDQLPESLVPSIYAVNALGLEWYWAIVLTLAFILLGPLISRPLYRLKIRKRPY